MGAVQDAINGAIGPKWRRVGVVAAVLLAVYLLTGLVFGMWPFSVARGLATKTVNAESIMSNYQWFYDQFNAIQAQKANVEAIDKGAPERSGMTMVLNNSIAEYNSRSKQINRNLWKASDLPYQVELYGGTK